MLFVPEEPAECLISTWVLGPPGMPRWSMTTRTEQERQCELGVPLADVDGRLMLSLLTGNWALGRAEGMSTASQESSARLPQLP